MKRKSLHVQIFEPLLLQCYFCTQNVFISKFGYMWVCFGAILTSSDVNAGGKGQGACAMVGQGLDCKSLSEILDSIKLERSIKVGFLRGTTSWT